MPTPAGLTAIKTRTGVVVVNVALWGFLFWVWLDPLTLSAVPWLVANAGFIIWTVLSPIQVRFDDRGVTFSDRLWRWTGHAPIHFRYEDGVRLEFEKGGGASILWINGLALNCEGAVRSFGPVMTSYQLTVETRSAGLRGEVWLPLLVTALALPWVLNTPTGLFVAGLIFCVVLLLVISPIIGNRPEWSGVGRRIGE